MPLPPPDVLIQSICSDVEARFGKQLEARIGKVRPWVFHESVRPVFETKIHEALVPLVKVAAENAWREGLDHFEVRLDLVQLGVGLRNHQGTAAKARAMFDDADFVIALSLIAEECGYVTNHSKSALFLSAGPSSDGSTADDDGAGKDVGLDVPTEVREPPAR